MANSFSVFRRPLVCAFISVAFLTGCDSSTQTSSGQLTSSKQAVTDNVGHESWQQQMDFAIAQVQITDGPFLHAQQTNIKYLMAMDPDRLLAPYLREAGLEPKAIGRVQVWTDTSVGITSLH